MLSSISLQPISSCQYTPKRATLWGLEAHTTVEAPLLVVVLRLDILVLLQFPPQKFALPMPLADAQPARCTCNKAGDAVIETGLPPAMIERLPVSIPEAMFL